MTNLTQHETPRPIVSLVSVQLKEKIEALPPELIDRPEHEILLEIRKSNPTWTPSELDFGIRLNFWREYTYAQQHRIQMRMTDIHKGVCSDRYFNRAVEDPHRLAYILCEFPDEAKKRKLGLSLLWNEMVKLIKSEIKNDLKTGLPDTKTMAQKLDLFKFLYSYEHGLPTQTINQTTKNLNYNVEATPQSLSPEDVNEKIKRLEAQALGISHEPQLVFPVEKVVEEIGRVTNPEFKR